MSEKTPLNETVQEAGMFAQDKMDELRQMASDGDFSIRMLALLGGIGVIVTSLIQVVDDIVRFHFIGVLMEIYTFLLGAIVIILESGKIPMSRRFMENLHKYALFLKFVWGRGLLYFVAGTLEISQMNWMDYISGGFMCLVGILYIYVGQSTARKLAEVRKSGYSIQTLRTKFREADVESKGYLTLEQFRELTQNVGMDLNRRETEAAFLCLDKNDDDKLTYDEFLGWWREWSDVDALGGNTGINFV